MSLRDCTDEMGHQVWRGGVEHVAGGNGDKAIIEGDPTHRAESSEYFSALVVDSFELVHSNRG